MQYQLGHKTTSRQFVYNFIVFFFFILFTVFFLLINSDAKKRSNFHQMTSQARCHFRLSTPGTNLVVIQSPQDRPHLLHMSPLPYTRPGGRINIRRRKILFSSVRSSNSYPDLLLIHHHHPLFIGPESDHWLCLSLTD